MQIEREEVRLHERAEQSDIEALRHATILSGLDDDLIGKVAAMAERRAYGRGEIIAGLEEECRVCIVVEGSARLYRIRPDGREIGLATIGRGQVFGLAYLSPSVQLKSLLEAVDDGTVVYRIRAQDFRRLAASDGRLALNLVDPLCRRLAEMTDQAETLGVHGVRTRLGLELADLAAADPERTVRQTQQELAGRIGTGREEVSRAIVELRRQGLVQTPARGLIVVPDPTRLRTEVLAASVAANC